VFSEDSTELFCKIFCKHRSFCPLQTQILQGNRPAEPSYAEG